MLVINVSARGKLNLHRQKKSEDGNKPTNPSLPSEQTTLFWGCGMTAKSESSFAVVRFNERTYQSGGVVAVIKGIELAQRTLDDFDWCQSEGNRRAGWRYFLEKTDLRPGMDPEKATQVRQVRFDLQES
jgi:hypothetical protein